jgi:hypothetical protein
VSRLHVWIAIAVTVLFASLAGGTALAGGPTLKVKGPGATVQSDAPFSVTVSGTASGKADTLITGLVRHACKSTLKAEPVEGKGPFKVHGTFKKTFKFPNGIGATGRQYFCAFLYHPRTPGALTGTTYAHASTSFTIVA